MKLLAIDGNSLINRAYYGIRILTTKDGRPTNAIVGFMNILNKLIDAEKPDCVAVAFDMKAPTFRHEKYADYKAGRKPMPDDLFVQFPIVKEILTLLGYHCIELEGYEADDIIGTLSEIFSSDGDSCSIATGDRDAFQLICDNVSLILASTAAGQPLTVKYDREKVFEKYGLYPESMLDLKALMGDSSDNIPGVAGVGEKTAVDLLKKFNTVDGIYENIESEDIKDSVRKKLIDGKQDCILSRWLGEICKTVPISNNKEDYLIGARNDEKLAALMTDLELYKLMEKWNIDPDCVKKELIAPENYSLDTEENVLKSAHKNKIIDIISLDDSYILSSDEKYFIINSKDIFADLYDILCDENINIYTDDAKRLVKICINNGFVPKSIAFDLSLAGYILDPSGSAYTLDKLCLSFGISAPDENNPGNLCAVFHSTCEKMIDALENNGQTDLLNDIEIPLSFVLAQMEIDGFMVDKDEISRLSVEWDERIKELSQKIYQLVGYEFNLNSPKQLGEALFEKLMLPCKKKTKSGYSTSAEVLEELRYSHPAIELLLEYRTLSKLKSTYCESLLQKADSTGRIHSTFNQTETRTGRISSSEPNLQNIPVRKEEGKKLRKCFIAREGYVLCDADYSQIELRVLAHMANDKAMINAFKNNEDIHTLTASQVFNMPPLMVTDLMRSRAKAVNFGIVYGIGAFSLAKDIGVSRNEASEYIKGYMQTYPGVANYMEKAIENAKKDGFVSTLYGRRRYLPELAASNKNLQAFGERVARNMPVQGTAADIIKIAMILVANRIKKEKLDARLILQVHDELIVEANENIAEKVTALICEEMKNACALSVEMAVDASFGKTWFEAKK